MKSGGRRAAHSLHERGCPSGSPSPGRPHAADLHTTAALTVSFDNDDVLTALTIAKWQWEMTLRSILATESGQPYGHATKSGEI